MPPELRHSLRGLYAVTQDDPIVPRLSALVGAALKGGVKLVQYRNKIAPAALRRAQAAELLRICRAAGARLIVNDDLALALEIRADGVHLGRDDGDLAAVRAALGPDGILGVSCYDEIARAEAAAKAGADYLAFGAMFSSPTKRNAQTAPLTLLTEAKQLGLPVVAIGGITTDNAASVIEAGADMVAVISGLFNAMDIAGRAMKFQEMF